MSGGKRVLGGPPGREPGPARSQERRPPAPLPGQPEAQAQPSGQSSAPQVVETQEWVSEPPPESRRTSRHWSLSIDERRQRALQDAMQSRPASHGQDILQVVARLVSEDVDKDVLIFHPPRSAESTHAFHTFLARSSPFWHNMTSAWHVASGFPPS